MVRSRFWIMGTGPYRAHGVRMESAWLERWRKGRGMWTSDRRRSQKIHQLTICAGFSLCEFVLQLKEFAAWRRIAQNYNFGTSEIVKKAVFKTRIHNLIDGLADYGPVFLTFHDNSQDIKSVPFLIAWPLTNLKIYRDLKTLGVELAGLSYVMPDANPENQIYVVDTSDLIGALLGEGSGSRRGLQKTCHLLQIQTDFLHNAGNDAHVSKPNLFPCYLGWSSI